jgi:hypothetical protein
VWLAEGRGGGDPDSPWFEVHLVVDPPGEIDPFDIPPDVSRLGTANAWAAKYNLERVNH